MYAGVQKLYDIKTGKLKYVDNYKMGVLHGKRLTYNDQGIVTYESNHKDGKRCGKLIHRSDDGKVITSELNNKDGKLHGKVIHRNIDGTITYDTDFYEDEKHGEEKVYNDDGTRKKKIIYKSCITSTNGETELYDCDGKLIEPKNSNL